MGNKRLVATFCGLAFDPIKRYFAVMSETLRRVATVLLALTFVVGLVPHGVRAVLERKSIQIGGQYLLALRVEGLSQPAFKAKVAPSVGERLPSSGPVTIELPLDQVTLFNAAGNRIAARLQPAHVPIAP